MTDTFENKKVGGIHYSRFIASWHNATAGTDDFEDIKEWLRTLTIDGKPIPEDDINSIAHMATCGKMELEHDCEKFLDGYLKN